MTEIRMDEASTVPAPPAAPGAQAWRRALPPLALVLVAVGLFFFESFHGMERIWARSDTFAHAYVVPPIALWLMWRQRAALALQLPSPTPWLLLPFGLLVLAWLVGQLVAVNALTQLAATALLVLTVPLVLGVRVALVILFPLAYLFFAVPIGEFMIPPLMQATADFTVAALRLSGIPVYREGLQFMIPSGSWSVVEACSGVRYLMASFMVGSLFAYLNYRSTKRRVIFALVSLAVPILANWLRAYMIVMLGHFSGNTLAVGVDHLIYGWVFFGIVIGVMFLVGARWAEPLPAPGGTAAVPPNESSRGVARLGVTAAAAGLILLVPHLVTAHFERQGRQAASAPLALGALPGTEDTTVTGTLEPVFLNPTATALRSYGFGGQVVTVHVGYYRHQGYGRKLVSSQNYLVGSDDKRWRRTAQGVSVQRVAGQSTAWRSTELAEGFVSASTTRGQRLDVRQVFWVDGRLTASNARATLYALWAKLLGRGDDGALITVYTAGDSATVTAARLSSFIEQHGAALQAQLEAYRSQR
jgi:exosortase A